MTYNYYKNRILQLVCCGENDLILSEDHWKSVHRANIDSKRDDLILYSGQMLDACRIARVIRNNPEKMDALKVKLYTLHCLENDIKEIKTFGEKYESIGIVTDQIADRLEKEADAARYQIEKIIDIG